MTSSIHYTRAQMPDWPPEESYPGAKRIEIDGHWIDYTGDAPSPYELACHFAGGDLKTLAAARIDAAAEAVRARLGTANDSQRDAYLDKYQDIVLHKMGNNPDATSRLAAEAAVTGESLEQLIAAVEASITASKALRPQIDGPRRKAKMDLEGTPDDKAAIEAIVLQAEATLNSIGG